MLFCVTSSNLLHKHMFFYVYVRITIKFSLSTVSKLLLSDSFRTTGTLWSEMYIRKCLPFMTLTSFVAFSVVINICKDFSVIILWRSTLLKDPDIVNERLLGKGVESVGRKSDLKHGYYLVYCSYLILFHRKQFFLKSSPLQRNNPWP